MFARADVYVTNQRRHWRCLGGEVKMFVSKAVFIIFGDFSKVFISFPQVLGTIL